MFSRPVCTIKQFIYSLAPVFVLSLSVSTFAFGGETKTNRLGKTSSPYLLHHADNPVDWFPWGPEALEKAKKENKPIFLSVGYSSCYWCHVMERLVFSDEKIAAYMNKHFVNIKVDREERPDIDDIYMTSLIVYYQATGSKQGGGWPLSMFLTPEGKPFAGGTYFPPKDQGGRLGFPTILAQVDQFWKKNEKGVRETADLITKHVQKSSGQNRQTGSVPVDNKLTLRSIEAVKDSFDEEYGGVDFSPSRANAPKFPVPVKLALLQGTAKNHADEKSDMVIEKTLSKMANGGIYDHLGGGFHRYSTDRKWHVPHFEKMLYDQAQLISVYVEEYRKTNNPLYKEVTEGICDFVLRELTDPQGGFYSALDAETDGVEGKYYAWDKKEVVKLLSEKNSQGFLEAYGFNENEKFEHGVVLHRNKSLEKIAEEQDRSVSKLAAQLNQQKKTLFKARLNRKPMIRDDKVLTNWNGLMIHALAQAGSVLGRQDYLDAAEKCTHFILKEMNDSEKNLLHSYYHGKVGVSAYLDDYAFLVKGLLTLHDVTDNSEWLTVAKDLSKKQIDLFWDNDGHGFYFTSHGHEELIARSKTAYDSVIPSGNSVAVRNFVKLWDLTGDDQYKKLAEESLAFYASGLKNSPRGMAGMALALSEYLAGAKSGGSKKNVRKTISEGVSQGKLILVSGTQKKSKKKGDELINASIFLSKKKLIPGRQCEVLLVVKIKPGWHINANPATPEGFVSTEFQLENKSGVKLERVFYPKGKAFTMDGIDDEMSVYEKRVIFYGVLSVPKRIKGGKVDLSFNVKYQACNHNLCKKATVVKLPASVAIAKPGEAVESNNVKLFKLYKKSMKKKKQRN